MRTFSAMKFTARFYPWWNRLGSEGASFSSQPFRTEFSPGTDTVFSTAAWKDEEMNEHCFTECMYKWLELGFLTLTVVSAVFLYLFYFWTGQGLLGRGSSQIQ